MSSGSVDATSPPALTQYLSFFVAGEEYAVGILQVKEIIEYDVVTRVPSMPECVRGVLNLRGRVVPVVDLALSFGLGESAVTRRSCIVVVEVPVDGEPAVMGMLVDAVSQVLDLRPEEVEPPPSFGTRVRADVLDGMGRNGRKFVMLLNLERALAVGASAAHAAPLAGDAPAGEPVAGAPDAAPAGGG